MSSYTKQKLVYLGEAASLPAQTSDLTPWLIARRGVDLGWIAQAPDEGPIAPERIRQRWQAAEALLLSGFLRSNLAGIQGHIEQAEQLVEKILAGEGPRDLVGAHPYGERLVRSGFELIASIYDENDDQEIEKLEFAAVEDGRTIAEDLWLKVAWLSFFDEDASLRFRFSFGMENYEDVAADLPRERLAARLCDAIFPESGVITENGELRSELCQIIGVQDLEYVERIVYFNGPQGGAQFHHDVERGHLGVVFAQLTGRTAWLALSTDALLTEIGLYLASPDVDIALRPGLRRYQLRPELLRAGLNDPSNEALDTLLNQTPQFFGQLVRHGYAYVLVPGDVLLLPQQRMDHCAWHSVYCLGEEMGEGLSFAIREVG